jgi:protease-4
MNLICALAVLLSVSDISALKVSRGLYMSTNPFAQFFPTIVPKAAKSSALAPAPAPAPAVEVITKPSKVAAPALIKRVVQRNEMGVPTNGLIDYIGRTPGPLESSTSEEFIPPTYFQELNTKFNLWKQFPWKKIKGKAVLKIKLGGSLPLEPSSGGGILSVGTPSNYEIVDSLTELATLFSYAAYDPRIKGVFIEMGTLTAGYAKLQELTHEMRLFRASGKKIIGFSETASEKELFVSQSFDAFYMPPDGSLDIRGFSGSATFLRGIFDKIGIEPQVQRIGKYKSFGDTFNRTSIAEAQREVISSLLTEASQFWLNAISLAVNKSVEEVAGLWTGGGIRTPYDFKDQGYITGVRYKDQVEVLVKTMFNEPKGRNI